jgi:hypothetical protein
MPKVSSLYKVEVDHRSSLYYDQYEWCATLHISDAHCLRDLKTVRFEAAIRNAKYWAEQEIVQNRRPVHHPWDGTAKESALRETCDILLEQAGEYKAVISFNVLSLYTNNRKLADRFVQLDNPGVRLNLVRQAVITKPAGVVQLQESKHGYRTYLRERKYNLDQRNLLLNFLQAREGTLRPCGALMAWLESRPKYYMANLNYSRSHYFVDHDHPNEGTMLSLVMPGIVRKTMPIETTK